MQFIVTFFFVVLFFSVSEVAILLWVSIHTGLLFTILACAFTGLLGGALVRQQGMLTLKNINQSISQGKLPADEVIGGLLLLIVGILLCVPGFITDTLGFLIIIPGIRHLVAATVRKRLTNHIEMGKSGFSFSSAGVSGYNQSSEEQVSEPLIEDAEIIDVTTKEEGSRK